MTEDTPPVTPSKVLVWAFNVALVLGSVGVAVLLAIVSVLLRGFE